MANEMILQKIRGYDDQYLLIGGQQPRVITKGLVQQNIAKLENQLQLQKQIVIKIEQMQSIQNKPDDPEKK